MDTFLLLIIIFLIIFSWKDSAPIFQKARKRVLVDTSILIDGRFLAVAKTGFVNFDILIPRSVVGELQILADGGDDDKRVRARYGLDIISALQSEPKLNVSILADSNSAKEGVDNRLISLAKKLNAEILTADYNLNKVAKVEGLEVLNINELVQSVRADYLPGEKIMLDITVKGNEKKQGVGHLPDGTMVVVENAESLVGTTAEVEFIRSLQTAAGKMMFARIAGSKTSKVDNPKSKGRAVKSSKIEKPAQNIQIEASKNENKKSKPKKTAKNKNNIQKSIKSKQKAAKSKMSIRRRTQQSMEADLVKLANRE